MTSVRYYEEEDAVVEAVVEAVEAVVEEEAAAQSSKNHLYPIDLIYLSELYNSTDFVRLLNIIDLSRFSLSSNSQP